MLGKAEPYLDLIRASMMELFWKNSYRLSAIFAKSYIIDVRLSYIIDVQLKSRWPNYRDCYNAQHFLFEFDYSPKYCQQLLLTVLMNYSHLSLIKLRGHVQNKTQQCRLQAIFIQC